MLTDFLIKKVKDEEINPIARAKALKRLLRESNLNSRQVAKKISKSPAYISNTLRLLKLPEALQDSLVSGLISAGHARALAAIENEREMIAAYKEILRQEGSVRTAEALARKVKANLSKKAKKKPDVFEKIKDEIAQSLGGATVSLSRSRVQTRVSVTFKGSYKKTDPWLRKTHRLLTKPRRLKGQ